MKYNPLATGAMFGKTTCLTLIAVLCIAMWGTTCLAKKPAGKQSIPADVQRVIDQYDLEVVNHAPAGVTPLTVDSASELETLLNGISAQRLSRPFELPSEIGGVSLESGMTCMYYHWRTRGFEPYHYNLAANVYVQNYGSFTWIDHISAVRFYLTGVVLGAYLKSIWTDSEIDSSNAQCAMISGRATECWYLMIKEVLTYYQRAVYLYRTANIAE